MDEHGAYWRTLADNMIAVVFGPVMDEKGGWGLSLVEASNDAEVRALLKSDPVVKLNVGLNNEVSPIAQAMLRKGL